MSAGASAPPAPQPLFSIVRGEVAPEELAALTAVLLTRARTAEALPPQRSGPARWSRELAGHRTAGAWATPDLPDWSSPRN